jgi:hypothetical protein
MKTFDYFSQYQIADLNNFIDFHKLIIFPIYICLNGHQYKNYIYYNFHFEESCSNNL